MRSSVVLLRGVRAVEGLVAVREGGRQGGRAPLVQHAVVEDGPGAQRCGGGPGGQAPPRHLLRWAEDGLLVRGELGDVRLEGVAPGERLLEALEDGGGALRDGR